MGRFMFQLPATKGFKFFIMATFREKPAAIEEEQHVSSDDKMIGSRSIQTYKKVTKLDRQDISQRKRIDNIDVDNFQDIVEWSELIEDCNLSTK